MDNIPLARGKTLDILASSLGLERKILRVYKRIKKNNT